MKTLKVCFKQFLASAVVAVSMIAEARTLTLTTGDGAWEIQADFWDESGHAVAASQLRSNVLYRIEANMHSTRGSACPSVIRFDAAMPTHYHGMSTKTKVEGKACTYKVSGVYFQMKGAWEFYFDIVVDAITTRAVFATELEK